MIIYVMEKNNDGYDVLQGEDVFNEYIKNQKDGGIFYKAELEVGDTEYTHYIIHGKNNKYYSEVTTGLDLNNIKEVLKLANYVKGESRTRVLLNILSKFTTKITTRKMNQDLVKERNLFDELLRRDEDIMGSDVAYNEFRKLLIKNKEAYENKYANAPYQRQGDLFIIEESLKSIMNLLETYYNKDAYMTKALIKLTNKYYRLIRNYMTLVEDFISELNDNNKILLTDPKYNLFEGCLVASDDNILPYGTTNNYPAITLAEINEDFEEFIKTSI